MSGLCCELYRRRSSLSPGAVAERCGSQSAVVVMLTVTAWRPPSACVQHQLFASGSRCYITWCIHRTFYLLPPFQQHHVPDRTVCCVLFIHLVEFNSYSPDCDCWMICMLWNVVVIQREGQSVPKRLICLLYCSPIERCVVIVWNDLLSLWNMFSFSLSLTVLALFPFAPYK